MEEGGRELLDVALTLLLLRHGSEVGEAEQACRAVQDEVEWKDYGHLELVVVREQEGRGPSCTTSRRPCSAAKKYRRA